MRTLTLMPPLLAALLLAASAAPEAWAQRVCRQVGQTVQCSDGSSAHPAGPNTYYQAVPPRPGATKPKDGTFEYLPDGTVCQVFGKHRYCR